jgi:hypothetical protein
MSVETNTEEIVRALAVIDPITYEDGVPYCRLCDGPEQLDVFGGGLRHEPTCVWRVAVDWVSTHD